MGIEILGGSAHHDDLLAIVLTAQGLLVFLVLGVEVVDVQSSVLASRTDHHATSSETCPTSNSFNQQCRSAELS